LVGILLIVQFIEFIRKIKIGKFEAEIGPKDVEKLKEKINMDSNPQPNECTKNIR